LTFDPAPRSTVASVDGLKVSELAGRSGVPASTVRYYEQQGLLPARRSSSGYRLYDDLAVDRLAFIGTAKGLGLELTEIRRLLEPWQHGQCSDVQRELLPLLERRLAQTRDRMRELDGFADRLALAHAQLEAIERDGPCDPSCTSLGRTESVAGTVLAALPLVDRAGGGDAIACSLGAADREDRVRAWGAVLAAVTERTAIHGGVRLTFEPDRLEVADLARLAASEVECCGFFDLTLHLGPPVRLDARAPEDALVLVHELFGEPGDPV
jgi:MerR family copper efflux transcriptional regulator